MKIMSAPQDQGLGCLIPEVMLLSNLAFESCCLPKGTQLEEGATEIYMLVFFFFFKGNEKRLFALR